MSSTRNGLKELQEAYGDAVLELRAPQTSSIACRARTRSDRDGLPMTQGDGYTALISQLCRWLAISRRRGTQSSRKPLGAKEGSVDRSSRLHIRVKVNTDSSTS